MNDRGRLHVTERAQVALSEDVQKLSPFRLGDLVLGVRLHDLERLVLHVHNQVNEATSNFNVNFPLSSFITSMGLLKLASTHNVLNLALFLYELVLLNLLFLLNNVKCLFLRLFLLSNFFSVLKNHRFASDSSLVGVSLNRGRLVLLEEFLNKSSFALLFIKFALGIQLVDHHFTPPSLSFLSSEVRVLFRFFNFVHSGRIAEVLNLTWRNSLLFLLALNCLVHVDVLIYA